jgi:hypothetical protein
MRPEPCKVQGCPALDVVQGGVRIAECGMNDNHRGTEHTEKNKSEIRISKPETIAKFEFPKFKPDFRIFSVWII